MSASQPLRVLQLSKFFPPVEGGIESAVATLTRGLRQQGVLCDVLCASTTRRSSHERLADGTQVWRAASLGLLQSTSMAPALITQLARLAPQYDLIHVHMPDPMAVLALRWVQPRARIVLHWHSDVVRQRLAMKLYAPLQRWVLQRADAVIATSPPYAEASKALQSVRHKVHVIPLGIDEPVVDAKQLAAVQARIQGRPLVFALGRHTYYKGFDVLVRAAAQLPPEALVVIGGDGPERPRLQALVTELGLQDRVWLPGRLDDEELHAWHAAATLFCLPSVARSEAFGVAMVEAMAAGKAVVATAIEGSGVPWVNIDGVSGLNAKPGDSASLAVALQTVLQSAQQREAYGLAARTRFQNELRGERMLAQTLELYAGLVG
jgi:rhamnosyl/mannosyltransferase